jgi:hypothetical protein
MNRGKSRVRVWKPLEQLGTLLRCGTRCGPLGRVARTLAALPSAIAALGRRATLLRNRRYSCSSRESHFLVGQSGVLPTPSQWRPISPVILIAAVDAQHATHQRGIKKRVLFTLMSLKPLTGAHAPERRKLRLLSGSLSLGEVPSLSA